MKSYPTLPMIVVVSMGLGQLTQAGAQTVLSGNYKVTGSLEVDGKLDLDNALIEFMDWKVNRIGSSSISFTSAHPSTANISLYVSPDSYADAVGSILGYYHPTNNYTAIGLRDTTGNYVFRSFYDMSTTPAKQKTEFYFGSTKIAGFYETGDFGIGTIYPKAKLHVAGTGIIGNIYNNFDAAIDTFHAGTSKSSGASRAIYARAEFSGTSNSNNSHTGIYALAMTGPASTGNLTGDGLNSGGGLRNRLLTATNGAGTVTHASGVSSGVNVNNGAIIDGASFHAERLVVAAGKSMGTYSGLWVRGNTIDGTLDKRYGVRVDTLQSGDERYGLYVQSDPTHLGGTLTVAGEVSGDGVSVTSAPGKLVKTDASGKIDASLLPSLSGYLTTTGNGSQLTGLTKSQVGLGNVDNTSDADKPLSTAQLAALGLKASATTAITAGTGLTGGGDLSANRTLSLGSAILASLAKADTALQPAGNGSQLTGLTPAQVGALPADGGTITTDGNGVINAAGLTATNLTATTVTAGAIVLTAPAGDISMGIYGNP